MQLIDNKLQDFISDIKKTNKINDNDMLMIDGCSIIFIGEKKRVEIILDNYYVDELKACIAFNDILQVKDFLSEGANLLDCDDHILFTYKTMSKVLYKSEHPQNNINYGEEYGVVNVKSVEFLRSIRKVRHSIAYNDRRDYLKGVFFEVNKDGMNLVASCGKTLSCEKIETSNTNDIIASNERVINSEVIKFLIAALVRQCKTDNESIVFIKFFKNAIEISFSNYCVNVQFCDMEFPEYKRFKKQSYDYNINFEKKELLEGLKFLKPLTNKKKISENTVVISKEVDKPLRISLANQQSGFFELKMAEYLGDHELNLKFQLHFLMEAINSIDNKIIHAKTSIEENIILHGQCEKSYRIVMPVFN